MNYRDESFLIGPTLHGYDHKAASLATSIDTGDISLTQQHERDEVDINTIVRRFGITQQMPSGVAGGVYGDFTGMSDYEDAVARIDRAKEGFMKLPAEVRDRVGNDPARLISIAQSMTVDEFGAWIAPPEAAVAPDVV